MVNLPLCCFLPGAGVATSAYDAYNVAASSNQYAAAYTAAAAGRQQVRPPNPTLMGIMSLTTHDPAQATYTDHLIPSLLEVSP